MPVIEVLISDLERLLGTKLTRAEVEDLLPRVKCEVESIEGDVVVYEATHDRPDLYSAEGLARALRGLLEIEVGLPKFKVSGDLIPVECRGPSYRPYVLVAAVRGLKLDDEAVRQAMQLQEKLHATYGRNRRKVSIGIYDLSKIEPPVRYVTVKPDEVSFVPLDFAEEMTPREILEKHPKGVEYGHLIKGYDFYPLLVDSKGLVLSMPPIINSEDTRVTEETRDVLIDVTGTDLRAMMEVLTVVATSLFERGEEIVRAEVKGSWGTEVSPKLDPYVVKFDPSLVKALGGVKMGVEEVVKMLEKMRMEARPLDEQLEVKVPAYRVDILHPVDLVEDVLMAYGYENIEPELLPPQHPGREDGLEVFSRLVREVMVGLGFQEVANYMLTNKRVLYELMNHPELPTVEVENPKQETYTCLRTWITPQLMQVLSRSKHADYPQRIFEVGDVALVDETRDNRVREERRLAIAIAAANATFTDIHAVVNSLMKLLGLEYELRRTKHPSLIDGRAAAVVVKGMEVGFLGEVHPEVLEKWELKVPVAVAELNLSALRDLLD